MSMKSISIVKKRLAIALAAAAFTFFSAASQAEGWFIGGGLINVSFEDDLDEVDSNAGASFSGGYRFDQNLSGELIFNLSAHDDALFDDDVLQSSVMTGAKYSFGGDRFRPYGVVGLSLNNLKIGDLDDVDDEDDFEDLDSLSGVGLYFGIGADIFIAKKHAINVGYRSNRWDDKDGGTRFDIQTDIVSVAYNFYFGD